MDEMTSRQRVVVALEHREPDRVPFDCPLSYGGYLKLKESLGYESSREVKPGSPWLSVSPPPDFLQRLNVDLLYIGFNRGQDTPDFQYGMANYVDEWGVAYRRIDNPTGAHYELAVNPLKDATIGDLQDYPWPDPYDPAKIEGLEKKCRDLYENTDFALAGKFSNSIFEQAFMLRGLDQLFMDLLLNPDFACALMEKLVDLAIASIDIGLKICGPYLQILRLAGDDMGHQRGTLLKPDMFRQLIRPRFGRLYREAKGRMAQYNPDMKLMAHTDGDVYPIIPDYIAMGLDILNPVQPYVAEMEHDKLKREFGDRLSFHAGMDIQNVLPFGSPEEVRAEVRKVIKALGPGGGYILAPTHYVQPDVPAENILAMRDAVLEFGRYPLAPGN
jgi:uroporphyrinogen decarboxylase